VDLGCTLVGDSSLVVAGGWNHDMNADYFSLVEKLDLK
jgi:hypothetical protein